MGGSLPFRLVVNLLAFSATLDDSYLKRAKPKLHVEIFPCYTYICLVHGNVVAFNLTSFAFKSGDNEL